MHQFPVTFETEDNVDSQALEKITHAFRQKLILQNEFLSQLRPDLDDPNKGEMVLKEVIRNLMVRKIDQSWQEHLLRIDHLRSDVHMRTVGQKDPLLEFKHESFAMFEAFSIRIREEIARDLFRFEMVPPPLQKDRKENPSKPSKSKTIAFTGGA